MRDSDPRDITFYTPDIAIGGAIVREHDGFIWWEDPNWCIYGQMTLEAATRIANGLGIHYSWEWPDDAA